MPFLNYNFRFKSLFFVGGINYTYFNNKISSLIFNSTGLVSYVPSRSTDKYFLITRLRGMAYIKSNLFRDIINIKPYVDILEVPFMLIQQKKNKSISFVELFVLKGSNYARSIGTCAKIIKLDTRTGLSLVKLPSGIKKIFSAFSLSQEGNANLLLLQNKFGNTKSGFWRNRGFKPKVRGVAMNPVDHPHGGRTKAIKYPRTPWGKTSKFK